MVKKIGISLLLLTATAINLQAKTFKNINELELKQLTIQEEDKLLKYLNVPKNIIEFYGYQKDKEIPYTKIYLQVKKQYLKNSKSNIDIIYRDEAGNYIIGDIITDDGVPLSFLEKKEINQPIKTIFSEDKNISKPDLTKPSEDHFSKKEEDMFENDKDFDEPTHEPILKQAFKEAMLPKYAKYRFELKGGNKDGEVVLIFSEPVCPACQGFEESGTLARVINNSKKVIMFVNPLKMHASENVYLRSKYLLDLIKPMMSNRGKVEVMKSAGHDSIDKIAKITDDAIVYDFWKDFRLFESKGLINATPTLTTIDGKNTRGVLLPIIEKEKQAKKNKNKLNK